MFSKFYLSFFVLLLGFVLMPAPTYACGSTAEKSCCKKEIAIKKIKKDCCKTKKEDKNENKKDNNCGGKCEHSNCTTANALNFSLVASFEMHFTNTNFDLTSKKSKFYHSEISISSGFTSVWSIPKIG